MKIIEIMGGRWKLIETNEISDDCDGETDIYQKHIKIRPVDSMLNGFGADDDEKLERYKSVLRHEFVHVMLIESGLTEYTNDETLVEWIAVKFPQMERLFITHDCSGNEIDFEFLEEVVE